MKLDCTSADPSIGASDTLRLRQGIEGQNVQSLAKGTSGAQSVTFSFWVKSNKTGTYGFEFRDQDNARHNCQTYTIDSANTWEKKTLTFAGDTSGALDNDNAMSLQPQWFLIAGSSLTSGTAQTTWASAVTANRAVGHNVNIADSTDNEWYICGVQMEIGSTATAFEHRSYGEELSLCQRYFHKQGGTAYYNIAVCVNYTSGAMLGTVRHPVQMRAAPSVTKSGTWATLGGDTTVNQTAVSSDSGPQASEIGFSGGSGGTSGRSCVLRFSNDANAYLWWDAEL